VKKGIVSPILFELFWEGCEYQDDVKKLMVSLGLMVPLQKFVGTPVDGDTDSMHPVGSSQQETEYLVPSILKKQSELRPPQGTRLTARAIFAAAEFISCWKEAGFIEVKEVESMIQVPDGVFSRLLGAMASLCQQTAPYFSIRSVTMFKDSCLFHLGTSSFSLINHTDYVGIYIKQGSGHEIAQVLQWQINAIMTSFLPGFDFLISVPSDGGTGAPDSYQNFDTFTVLTGERGVKAREKRGEGMIVSASENLIISELRDRFSEWVAQVFLHL
jgi:hypothetical protein